MALKVKEKPAKKNKGGRPRLQSGSDTVGLMIKMTIGMRESFQGRCEAQGLVGSEVIRELIQTWLKTT